MNANTRNSGDSGGSILLIVLWWLVILTIMGVALYVLVQPRLDLAARLKAGAEARSIGTAIIEDVRMLLAEDETPGFDALNAPWSRNEELFHNRQLGVTRASVGYVVAADKPFADEDFSVWYGLADEERRLNVNKAPLEVLERMLEEVAGLGSLDSRPLAAAIVDWRDEDDSPEKYGAEASYYKTLNPPYACRDAPFQLIEELMLVKGMTPEIYRQTSPHLTVFGTGAVNINTTTAPVLVCLGLDEGLAEDIIRFRSGPDGEAGTGDDQVFERVGEIIEQLSEGMALSRDEEAAVRHAVNSAQLTVRSDNFRGNILRTLDNQPPRVQITFVVNRNGVVRQWREL